MSHSNLEVAIPWEMAGPESVFAYRRCNQGVRQSGGSCILILASFGLDLAHIEGAEGRFLV